jgi:enoyl-CoA hydratase/3-hydroxyacyl-CoA dehydrogenase
MNTEQVKKVAILGAGVMGHGIGQVIALAGYQVVIRDIAQEFLDNAAAGIKSSLSRLVERGRLSQEDMDLTMSRIHYTLNIGEAVSDAQLIMEAIPERLDIKHKVWKDVASKAPSDAILASNTSSLSITKIAEAVSNPERFVGMHFFNPPVIMKLVEVNQGNETSDATVEVVVELARRIGKTPIWVKKDSPGFVVNRVLITYLNEASKLLEKYSKEQIDAAMQHKAGMPIGPFMLSDLIGLDIVYNVLKVFEESFGSWYAPDKHIVELYEACKFGRKTGEGFYNYEGRPTVTEDQAHGFDVRLLLKPLIDEAEKVVSEGIASENDVDTAMKLGANLTKGPFEMKKAGIGEEKPILKETEGGVLTITLNRPAKANSITLDMLEMKRRKIRTFFVCYLRGQGIGPSAQELTS